MFAEVSSFRFFGRFRAEFGHFWCRMEGEIGCTGESRNLAVFCKFLVGGLANMDDFVQLCGRGVALVVAWMGDLGCLFYEVSCI